eukprot:244869-Pelagomonas_calceolata.AAC.5
MTIINTRPALHFQGASWGGGCAGHMAVEIARKIGASRSITMADNPPDPHLLCFWLSPRLARSSIGLKALW